VATIGSTTQEGNTMTDQPTTPSGSRWEPTAEDGEAVPESRIDQTLADPLPSQEPYRAEPAADDERRAQLRGRTMLAGAATALTLLGGLTGFLIGHSTAGNGGNDFRPAGLTGQVPGSGGLGEGQQAPPQFGDRDGDRAGGPDGDGGPGGLGGSGGFGSSNSSTDGSGTAANPT
jgi:hypothetical protein